MPFHALQDSWPSFTQQAGGHLCVPILVYFESIHSLPLSLGAASAAAFLLCPSIHFGSPAPPSHNNKEDICVYLLYFILKALILYHFSCVLLVLLPCSYALPYTYTSGGMTLLHTPRRTTPIITYPILHLLRFGLQGGVGLRLGDHRTVEI